jgi:hypothetical protein
MAFPTVFALVLAAQTASAEALPVVTATHFLAMDPTRGEAGIVETRRIPHRPGASCYQWVIAVAPESRRLAIRELFELPAPAEQWGTDPNPFTEVTTEVTTDLSNQFTAVAADRSRAVTQIDESLDDGLLTHGWCVAEGDPAGLHRIRVFVGERLLHQFDFEIIHDTY